MIWEAVVELSRTALKIWSAHEVKDRCSSFYPPLADTRASETGVQVDARRQVRKAVSQAKRIGFILFGVCQCGQRGDRLRFVKPDESVILIG